MNALKRRPLLLMALCSSIGALAVACTSAVTPAKTTTTATTATTATTTANDAEKAIGLHLLLTADEHGWLQPVKDKDAKLLRGGVHNTAHTMAAQGYAKDKPSWLLVSAGDMWTGPYETTVLEGAPMTAVMHHLGYHGAAVGNHEFDFGQSVLAERRKAAEFPFLAANLIDTSTGQPPPWAQPYTVVDVRLEDGGIAKVAIVGLACFESPVTADVRNMVGLKFQPYDHALEHWLPIVGREGADIVIVTAHDAISQLLPLVPLLRAHGVNLIAAGHEHRPGIVVDDNGSADPDDDVVLCNAGPYLRTLCRVDLAYVGRTLKLHAEKIVPVTSALDAPPAPFDDELARILNEAEESANRIGGEVLVDSKNRLDRGREGALGQLVVDAWLEALPYAQFALTNAGGLRQDIEPGPLRLRDIVSALPFNNYLLVVDMTGAELRDVLANPESVLGGGTYTFREEQQGARIVTALFDREGRRVADDAKLKVVINDFMYRGGDHYGFLDREPEETAMDWREPIFRLLRGMKGRGQTLVRAAEPRARRE